MAGQTHAAEGERGATEGVATRELALIGIGAGLWFILESPAVAPHVSRGWLLLSVVGTVVAWIGGVVWVASRQRVPVYDREYEPPKHPNEGE